MVKTIEAIYANGVLKPLEALPLEDQQRGRITIEEGAKALPASPDPDKKAALERLFAGIKRSKLHLEGPLPTRDELHERGDRDRLPTSAK